MGTPKSQRDVVTMKKNRILIFIFKKSTLLLLTFLIILNVGYQLFLHTKTVDSIEEAKSTQTEILNAANISLNSYLVNIEAIVLEISTSYEVQEFLLNSTTKSNLESNLLNKMTFRSELTQVRLINEDGFETVRINYDGSDLVIIPEENLQDKSARDYFINTSVLNTGEVYVSQLDYNMEYDEIVIPLEPVIRFATPLYLNNVYKGILIINVDAVRIMEHLSEFNDISTFNLSIGLADNDSYWSFSDDSESDFLYYQKDEDSTLDLTPYFYRESDHLLYNHGSYEYDELIYTTQEHIIYHDDSNTDHLKLISILSDSIIKDLPGNSFLFSPYAIVVINFTILVLAHIISLVFGQRSGKIKYSLVSNFIADYNSRAVIVTNNDRKTLYVNSVWANTYEYNSSEMLNKDPVALISEEFRFKIKSETSESNKVANSFLKSLVWNRTKSGIFVLKLLTLKTISATTKKDSYYVGIYEDPKSMDIQVIDLEKPITPQNQFDHIILKYIGSKIDKSCDNSVLVCINYTVKQDNEDSKKHLDEFSLSKKVKSKLDQIYTNINSFFLSKNRIVFHVHLDYKPIESLISELLYSITEILGEDKNTISVNIGVSKYEDSIEEFIKSSFYALTHSITYKTDYTVYSIDVKSSLVRSFEIHNKLDEGFNNERFSVVYQPQRNTKTRAIASCEALSRWTDPDLGTVYPNEFIPMLIDRGMITSLTKLVVKTVIRDAEKYISLIPEDFIFSVNITVADLDLENLKTGIVKQINNSIIPNSHFAFEIVEDMLMKDISDIKDVFKYIKSQNIRIYLDDFGTGYSSLAYLTQFKFDKIKIDRQFIMDYPKKDNGSLIKLIKSLATELHVPVIMEGVETESQLEFISRLECEQYQGFLDSRPTYLGNFIRKVTK